MRPSLPSVPMAGDAEPAQGVGIFALVHLIEETARRLGHLDVIREQLDGTTGG